MKWSEADKAKQQQEINELKDEVTKVTADWSNEQKMELILGPVKQSLADPYHNYSLCLYDAKFRANILKFDCVCGDKKFTNTSPNVLQLMSISFNSRTQSSQTIVSNNIDSLKPFINWFGNDILFNKGNIISFIWYFGGINKLLTTIFDHFHYYDYIQTKLGMVIFKQLTFYPQIFKQFCCSAQYFIFLNLYKSIITTRNGYMQTERLNPNKLKCRPSTEDELTEFNLFHFNILFFRTVIYWYKHKRQLLLDWIDKSNIVHCIFGFFQERTVNWTCHHTYNLSVLLEKHKQDQNRLDIYHKNNYLMHNLLRYLYKFCLKYKGYEYHKQWVDLGNKSNQYQLVLSLSMINKLPTKLSDGTRELFPAIKIKMLRVVRRKFEKTCQYMNCKKFTGVQSLKTCKTCRMVLYCS
eukprot:167548_1